jgi:hypothetical protein
MAVPPKARAGLKPGTTKARKRTGLKTRHYKGKKQVTLDIAI